MREIYKNLPEEFTQYPKDVLSGKIIAGEALKLACQRYLDWFDREDFYFDWQKADKIKNFIQSMKHSEDEFAGKQFILMDWQKFLLYNIFCWYKDKNRSRRVIRNVFMLIARKNAKSATSAAIALASLVCDGIQGSEIYLLGNTKDQAKILLKFCKNYASSLDPKQKFLKQYRDQILYPKTKSSIRVLAGDNMKNDGYNPSMFILDEFHAADNWDLYNVMKSGQAARKNPLSMIITSAGTKLTGYPCYEEVNLGYDILRGLKKDDSKFYLMFQLDKDDDFHDKSVWKKAIPSYGITVDEEYMEERLVEADNNAQVCADVQTKNFSIFVQTSDVWIPDKDIVDNMEFVELKKLKNEVVYLGIDLSTVSDLTSISLMFPPNVYRSYFPDKFIFKSIPYIAKEALSKSVNKRFYAECIQNGQMRQAGPGRTIDYDYVLKDLMEICNNLQVVKASYDPWNASEFTKIAENEGGLPMVKFGQGLGNFNIPTKEFERLLLNGQVIIDKNIVTKFCFGNAMIKEDIHDNYKPVKDDGDKNKKIDVCISMLEALGGYLQDKDYYYGPCNVNVNQQT